MLLNAEHTSELLPSDLPLRGDNSSACLTVAVDATLRAARPAGDL